MGEKTLILLNFLYGDMNNPGELLNQTPYMNTRHENWKDYWWDVRKNIIPLNKVIQKLSTLFAASRIHESSREINIWYLGSCYDSKSWMVFPIKLEEVLLIFVLYMETLWKPHNDNAILQDFLIFLTSQIQHMYLYVNT